MVRIRVPATTANLGPGFDSLGMAVAIYNFIELERLDGDDLKIEVDGAAASEGIALDEHNLVYRAAAKVLELAGESSRGLRMRVSIDAPLARGLGSSASAIAGGMFAANELVNRPFSMHDLARETTRMEGHPDNVIPCLVGGLTASLRLPDDTVLIERVEPSKDLRCVFFIPDYELDTATARGVMPKNVSMKDAVFNGSRIPFVLARLQSGNFDDLDLIMDDRLHQPYRIPLIKGFEMVADAVGKAGGAATCISGAGPTILAVASPDVADAVAKAGLAALEDVGVRAMARVVSADTEGCQREE